MDRAHATAAGPAARGTDDVRAPIPAETEADRRVEDWIASRIDGERNRPRAAEWTRRVEVASPGRSRPDRAGATAAIVPHRGWKRIRVEQHGDLTAVHLLDEQLLGEAALAELRGELRDLAAAGCSRIVLSVANVDRVSSQFLEILATLDQHCRRCPGGRLKLSRVGPELARLLELSGLDHRFEVVPDLAAALSGPWPAGARRIPFGLLSELNGRSRPRAEDEPSTTPEPILDPEATIAPPSSWLRVRREGEGLATLPVPPGGIRIGREAPCEIRARNRAVSRVHAWIGERDGRLVLEDLGSTNGTTVDGRLVRGGVAPIRSGSTFVVGPFEFELSDDPPIVESILSEWNLDADRPETETDPIAPSPAVAVPDEVPLESGRDGSVLHEERVEGVLVLSPTMPRVDDEGTLDAVRDHLEGVLQRPGATPRVVINLAPLVSLSGRAIGLIVAHHLRLQRLGGCLRLAQASASVATALDVVGLAALIETFPTIEDAVLSRWPE